MRRRAALPEPEGEIALGAKAFEGDRQFVAALHRGLEILRAFRPGDDGLGNQELSERTGLGPSTVSRLTYTLSRLGYLRYDRATGRYRLGVAVLGLGYNCLAGFRIREAAQPRMQDLADSFGGGVLVALSARDNLRMTYLACARSEGVMSLQLDVGSRLSIASSAAGRAWLAAAPEAERERIIEELAARADPESWPATLTGIRDAIRQVAERGFCTSLGQWRSHVNTAGVPVRVAAEDGALYALTLGGAAYNLPRRRLEAEVGPRLMELAAGLSRS
ncbi:MAG: IclR family transcriptional regulator [Pseudomonadota bacterium]